MLNDAAYHGWPFDSRNSVLRFGRAWMPVCDWQQGKIGSAWVLLKTLLEFLREETRGGMEVDEHW